MATRQEIAIAFRAISDVNSANDLIDSLSYIFRDINPSNGEPLSFDLDTLKTKAAKVKGAILGYWNEIQDFKTAYGTANLASAINSLGVSASELKDDIDAMKNVVNYLSTQLPDITEKSGLIPLADYIDANIPKIPMVRRSWNVGE